MAVVKGPQTHRPLADERLVNVRQARPIFPSCCRQRGFIRSLATLNG